MDDRQVAAVTALASGKTLEEAANASGRSPKTVMKWLEEPELQSAFVRGLRALALQTLARYIKHGDNPKAGQAALATLKWLGAGKPQSARKAESKAEEETDLEEFSADQLRRLKGDM